MRVNEAGYTFHWNAWCCHFQWGPQQILARPACNVPSTVINQSNIKRDVQIQCNTSTYSQTFFPSTIWLWNTVPVDICQLPPGSFKTHLNSFNFILAQDYILFLWSALRCFYPKLLFIVCCTAFSIHICLFTLGVILLGIETAPLPEDEVSDVTLMSGTGYQLMSWTGAALQYLSEDWHV